MVILLTTIDHTQYRLLARKEDKHNTKYGKYIGTWKGTNKCGWMKIITDRIQTILLYKLTHASESHLSFSYVIGQESNM